MPASSASTRASANESGGARVSHQVIPRRGADSYRSLQMDPPQQQEQQLPCSMLSHPHILDLILSYADNNTLAAMLRVSQVVCTRAAHHLYHVVVLDPGLGPSRSPLLGSHIRTEGRATRQRLSSDNGRYAKRHLLEHTEVVSTAAHSFNGCQHASSPHARLPRLRVWRFELERFGCSQPTTCGLSKALMAPHIVSFSRTGGSNPLYLIGACSVSALHSAITSVTIVVPSGSQAPTGSSYSGFYNFKTPKNLRSLHVVLLPSPGDGVFRCIQTTSTSFRNLVRAIADPAIYTLAQVTVFGAEFVSAGMDVAWGVDSLGDYRTLENEIRFALDNTVDPKHISKVSPETAAKYARVLPGASSRLAFKSLKEYLEHPQTAETMLAEERVTWLDWIAARRSGSTPDAVGSSSEAIV